MTSAAAPEPGSAAKLFGRNYAYTRAIADHMFANHAGVLKIDGEVGNKKAYDPRSWGKTAEVAMAARVTQACADLRSTGTH